MIYFIRRIQIISSEIFNGKIDTNIYEGEKKSTFVIGQQILKAFWNGKSTVNQGHFGGELTRCFWIMHYYASRYNWTENFRVNDDNFYRNESGHIVLAKKHLF